MESKIFAGQQFLQEMQNHSNKLLIYGMDHVLWDTQYVFSTSSVYEINWEYKITVLSNEKRGLSWAEIIYRQCLKC